MSQFLASTGARQIRCGRVNVGMPPPQDLTSGKLHSPMLDCGVCFEQLVRSMRTNWFTAVNFQSLCSKVVTTCREKRKAPAAAYFSQNKTRGIGGFAPAVRQLTGLKRSWIIVAVRGPPRPIRYISVYRGKAWRCHLALRCRGPDAMVSWCL